MEQSVEQKFVIMIEFSLFLTGSDALKASRRPPQFFKKEFMKVGQCSQLACGQYL